MARYHGGVSGDRKWPVILVMVEIPRLNIARVAPFLVDTGADTTALSAKLLGTKPQEMGRPAGKTRGIGGSARRWRVEGARLRVRQGDSLLDITPAELFTVEGLDDVHLLGRDILQQHRLAMHFDIPGDELYFETRL